MSQYDVTYEYVPQQSREYRVNSIAFYRNSKVVPRRATHVSHYDKNIFDTSIRDELAQINGYKITIANGVNMYEKVATPQHLDRSLDRAQALKKSSYLKRKTLQEKLSIPKISVRDVIRPGYLDSQKRVNIPIKNI